MSFPNNIQLNFDSVIQFNNALIILVFSILIYCIKQYVKELREQAIEEQVELERKVNIRKQQIELKKQEDPRKRQIEEQVELE